jgi:hypothetical protein
MAALAEEQSLSKATLTVRSWPVAAVGHTACLCVTRSYKQRLRIAAGARTRRAARPKSSARSSKRIWHGGQRW